MIGTVFINKGDVVGDKIGGNASIWHGTEAEYEALPDTDDNTFYNLEDKELIATTDNLGFVKPDGTTITVDEDGTISADSKTRILELNSPLNEVGILNVLKNNEGYECSGFFYNTDKSVYCEFEGLYSGHVISGETVHFGYCHIRGIHNSQYSADYYIDDEDGSTWYKKVPVDYLTVDSETSETSTNLIQNQAISKKLAKKISYADYLNLTSAEKNNGRPYYVYDYPDGLNLIDDTANNKTRVWSSEKSTSETNAIKNTLDNLKADYLEFNTTYGKLELHKKGGCVSMYGTLSNMPTNATLNLGKLPQEFASNFNYGFGYLLSYSPPYAPIGSVWIGGQGDVTLYKPSGITTGYAVATYTNYAD